MAELLCKLAVMAALVGTIMTEVVEDVTVVPLASEEVGAVAVAVE